MCYGSYDVESLRVLAEKREREAKLLAREKAQRTLSIVVQEAVAKVEKTALIPEHRLKDTVRETAYATM